MLQQTFNLLKMVCTIRREHCARMNNFRFCMHDVMPKIEIMPLGDTTWLPHEHYGRTLGGPFVVRFTCADGLNKKHYTYQSIIDIKQDLPVLLTMSFSHTQHYELPQPPIKIFTARLHETATLGVNNKLKLRHDISNKSVQ